MSITVKLSEEERVVVINALLKFHERTYVEGDGDYCDFREGLVAKSVADRIHVALPEDAL